MTKRFVVLFVVAMLVTLTSCDRNENATNVPKKTELEIVQEIKAQGEIGQYDLNDGWEKVFYLGSEGELVLLKKGDTVILADDSTVGNSIYEEVTLEKGMEPQGAGSYIWVKDIFGAEYGLKTVKNPEDFRIGVAQNEGDTMKDYISDIPEEEQDYIHYTYWDWVQPQPTTN